MPTVVTVDFRGSPPRQGGASSDHVKPGQYHVVVTSSTSGMTKTNKPMYTFWFKIVGGEYDDKKLVDRFTMPNEEDKVKPNWNFGIQRFHAFLNAAAMFPGEKLVKIDLDKLINRHLMVLVDDEDQTDNDGNKTGRVQSRNIAYDPMPGAEKAAANGATNGKAAAATAAPAATAPAPATAPAAASGGATAVADPPAVAEAVVTEAAEVSEVADGAVAEEVAEVVDAAGETPEQAEDLFS